ncbi:MAG: hypothetical protein QOJ64_3154 [Acidobacteriota bacterium]|jgi:uncharacterized protein (DUF1697 family)|nr:hypothetical protein [Acidobacteriota bacterium]
MSDKLQLVGALRQPETLPYTYTKPDPFPKLPKMPRLVAFLRAINVGGHTVKMDRLRELFESIGYVEVETFIASGNVVFKARSSNTGAHEKKIEKTLREALGYEVATFVRTLQELEEIANHQPFSPSALESAVTFGIAFTTISLDVESTRRLMALRSEIDDFHVREREIYWISRSRQGEATISNAVFERIVGRPATLRGVNTVKRMAAKYSRSKP